MKKKKISILITICLLLIVGTRNVKAATVNLYNGSGTNQETSKAPGNYCTATFCSWQGSYKIGLKISLYYIDNAKFYEVKQINDKVVKPAYISWSQFSSILGFSVSPNANNTWPAGTWTKISEGVARAFGAPTNNYTSIDDKTKFEDTFKKVFGVEFSNVNFESAKDSQPSSETKTAEHGYRIIIEPVLQFYEGGKYNLYTFKQISYKMANGGRYGITKSNSYEQFSGYLTVKVKDVGIDAQTGESCNRDAGIYQTNKTQWIIDSLKENSNGCGFNIIDITNVIDSPKCYTRTITGDLTCKNVDKNNEALFYETYKETDCDKISKEEETNTENGRLIATKDNCNLYCVESAYASFPGGISPESELGKQIFQGSYFAWPKLHNSSNMNMYMTSSLECSFVSKNNGTCSNDEIAALKDTAVSEISGNKFKFNANLTAGTNREINEPLKQVDSKITVTSSKNSKDEQKYTVSKTTYFEIYENVNRIFDRTTGKVYDGTKIGIGQVDRGAGFISLGNNDDVDKEYDLKISNIELGSSYTKFGDRIKDYVCHYQLSQKCSCPPGTKYAGKSLQKYIDQGYTCVQAQNDKSIIEKECNNKYVCRNNTNIDISNCVENIIKNGGSENDAIEYCEKKELKCNPFACKNTNSGTDIPISECVYEKANGKNLIDNKEEIRKIAEECAKAEPECNNTCYDNVNFCVKYENKSKIACENEYKCCPEALTCEKEQGKSYTECFKEKCVNPYNYTCKFLGQTISLNDCINKEGKTYGQCFAEHCNTDTKCDTEPCYFCKTKSGENHDISSCVAREVAINNKTIKQAIKTCTVNTAECADYGKGTCLENCKWKRETKAGRVYYIKTCSDSKEICDTIDLGYCKDGKCQKIVYRTIDLNNPFPGKNGNGATGDFSNNGTGRYPNSNWNYSPLVYEKILHARGAEGDKLYTLKPLYTIVLTPENMRNIKSKTSGYNDNNNYSDFTLKCLDTKNNSSCVSTFLRDSKYVTIDSSNSECGNITNTDEFNKCYGDRIN